MTIPDWKANILLMPYRTIPFITGQYYHIFNRGLEKQDIFYTPRDYQRFIEALFYYQTNNSNNGFSKRISNLDYPEDKLVEVICYCLMPNHFHLLLKQLQDGGISKFMRLFTHSYTSYRNLKHKRQGPVFQGIFKAVRIESDEQLLHLSRYIHLNPYVAFLVKDLSKYPWSSYPCFVGLSTNPNINPTIILEFFKSPNLYKQFIADQKDYARSLKTIQRLLFDL